MNINFFNISWINIADNLIPWYWRDLEQFSPGISNRFWLRDYIRSALLSIEDLTNRLFELAFNIDKKIKRTGQVGVMEIALNEDFDIVLKRIFLSDAWGAGNYNYDFYLQGETDPTPQSFYKQGEVDPDPKIFFTGVERAGEFDFYVNLPIGLSLDFDRFNSVIDTYKNAGKSYDIIFF